MPTKPFIIEKILVVIVVVELKLLLKNLFELKGGYFDEEFYFFLIEVQEFLFLFNYPLILIFLFCVLGSREGIRNEGFESAV